EVFPNGTLYGALEYPGFYLTGSPMNTPINADQREEMYQKLASIEELGEWTTTYRDPVKLRNLYLAEGSEVLKLLADIPAVTDDKPYTEFPLWREFLQKQGFREFVPELMRTQLKNQDTP
ncbi:MAG TPA: hypothetical protein PKA06_15850, partial [Gemmatales bacterium]|nr:hypothetical protein [Gemmatales bacterium]